MKKTSKALSLLLALLVVLSLGVTAFATGSTITVENTLDSTAASSKGVTYSAYLILRQGVDSNSNTVYYLTDGDSSMKTLLSGTSVGLVFADEATSVTPASSSTAENGYIVSTEKQTVDGKEVLVFKTTSGTMTAEELTRTLKNNASSVKTAAGNNMVKGTYTTGTGSQNIYTISSIETAGYYYIDSLAGAVVSVDGGDSTTATVQEKELVPNIVKGASTGTDDYKSDISVDVDDKVNYKLVVNNGNVQKAFTITDKMPAGMTSVKETGDTTTAVTVTTGSGDDLTTWTKDTDYTVTTTTDTTGQETIVITLLYDKTSNTKLTTIEAYTDITITYSATMNTSDNAVTKVTIGTTGNTNAAQLEYDGGLKVTESTVKTYEIGYDGTTRTFRKIDGSTNADLSGATFQLSKTEGSTTYYAQVDSSGYLTGWTLTESEATDLVTGTKGDIHVMGLAAGEYILTETEPPTGYNKLITTITVTIDEDTGAVTYKTTGSTGTGENEVVVRNNKGGTLPSTGGVGTTVFYVVGGLMVAAALILLITKKRMSGYQD